MLQNICQTYWLVDFEEIFLVVYAVVVAVFSTKLRLHSFFYYYYCFCHYLLLESFSIFLTDFLCCPFYLRRVICQEFAKTSPPIKKAFTESDTWRSSVSLQLYLKKDSGTVFSCEFCEISKNTFFLQNTSGGCFCLKGDYVYYTTSFHHFKSSHGGGVLL